MRRCLLGIFAFLNISSFIVVLFLKAVRQTGLLPCFGIHKICYQIPSRCCIKRLTTEMPPQQQKPSRMGLAPVRISLMMLVFRPMAAIAMIIRNLLKFLRGSVTAPGRLKTVVTTEASTKKRTKKGKILRRSTWVPDAFFSSLRVR